MSANKKRAPRNSGAGSQTGNSTEGAIHETGSDGQYLSKWDIVRLVAGLITALLTLYILLSFISHLFTWQSDQSLRWVNQLQPFAVKATNLMGTTGAAIASWFMSRGLGIAAFGFVYILMLSALYLFKFSVPRLARKFTFTLFGMLLGSVVLAFFTGFCQGYLGFGLGGRLGFYVSQWLIHNISAVGTFLLLFVLTVCYLILMKRSVADFLFITFPNHCKALYQRVASKRDQKQTTADAPEMAHDPRAPQNDSQPRNVDPSSPSCTGNDGPMDIKKAPERDVPSTQPEAKPFVTPREEGAVSYPIPTSTEGSNTQTSDTVGHPRQTTPTDQIASAIPEGNETQNAPMAQHQEMEGDPIVHQAASTVETLRMADIPEAPEIAGGNETQNAPLAQHQEMEGNPIVHQAASTVETAPAPTPTEAPSKTVLESITRNTTRILESDSENFISYNPQQDPRNYRFPKSEYLSDHGEGSIQVSDKELNDNKDHILDTLLNYKISTEHIRATVGPSVTLYEIIPSPGIRINQIKNLEDDIALSLAALGIRIIAPMPGRGTIGIEVPNKERSVVSMLSVIRSEEFRKCTFELPIAIGKTIENRVFIFDLAKAPHLLVAGATGQGKSVGLNTLIISLLYKKRPSELKFLLFDPKKVELSLYQTISAHYLLTLSNGEPGIVTQPDQAIDALLSLSKEMDNRYLLLKDAKVRNIQEYNDLVISGRLPNHPVQATQGSTLHKHELHHHYLPYVVVLIDEYGDLIMTAGKDIELPLVRLAQVARAVGIHLVVATQRPQATVITGLIKANFPARIAFRVSSSIDSRTILEQSGAQQLIGKGDMLISLGGDPVRLQCAFVDTSEINEICNHIAREPHPQTAFVLPEADQGGKEGNGNSSRNPVTVDDEFYDCARYVVSQQRCSASSLQTNFSIGYSKAARIVNHLEYYGIVGEQPSNSQRTRDVLIGDLVELEPLLDRIKQAQ